MKWVLVFFFLNGLNCLAQSKKSQIENLELTIDSLNKVNSNERLAFEKSKTELTERITFLENENQKIQVDLIESLKMNQIKDDEIHILTQLKDSLNKVINVSTIRPLTSKEEILSFVYGISEYCELPLSKNFVLSQDSETGDKLITFNITGTDIEKQTGFDEGSGELILYLDSEDRLKYGEFDISSCRECYGDGFFFCSGSDIFVKSNFEGNYHKDSQLFKNGRLIFEISSEFDPLEEE